MPYTIEQLPDEPIIIMTLDENYSVQNDFPKLDEELGEILKTVTESPVVIVDMRKAKFSLQDMILGSNVTAKSQNVRSPIIKQSIIVTQSKGLATAVKGLDTITFGNLKILLFPTVEEALTHARSIL